MDTNIETRVALLEERHNNALRRMDALEKQNERDIGQLATIIKENETRIMQFVQREFEDVETKLSEVISSAKELKSEQAKLSDATREQQQQIKVNEAQTAQAILGIAALVAVAEIVLRYVL